MIKRKTGFEPATPTLARWCSTTELLPHVHGNFLPLQGAIPQLLGVMKLNFCVRNGNRCILHAIVTALFKCWKKFVLSKLDSNTSEKTAFWLWLSPRPISNGPLHASRHFHFHPIYLIISQGSYFQRNGKSNLEASFTLRCFQRLSHPYIATQRCPWQNNWYTSGMSIPVLSY